MLIILRALLINYMVEKHMVRVFLYRSVGKKTKIHGKWELNWKSDCGVAVSLVCFFFLFPQGQLWVSSHTMHNVSSRHKNLQRPHDVCWGEHKSLIRTISPPFFLNTRFPKKSGSVPYVVGCCPSVAAPTFTQSLIESLSLFYSPGAT